MTVGRVNLGCWCRGLSLLAMSRSAYAGIASEVEIGTFRTVGALV